MTDPIIAFARRRGYELISDAEAATVDVVVCGAPGPRQLPGSIAAKCSRCDDDVVHGPLAPAKPKICRTCFELILKDKAGDGEPVRLVSTRSEAQRALLARGMPEGRA